MTTVDVSTGSRLHFGLLCASPGTPWHYGGIGLMVADPGWQLRVSTAESDQTLASTGHPDQDTVTRVATVINNCRRVWPELPPLRTELQKESAWHAGVGAGTQLTLAVARAAAILAGHPTQESLLQTAQRLNRVRRSAIGTHGFERGGFLIDHGQPRDGTLQRQITRLPFPENWRIVMVTPNSEAGVSGEREETVFRKPRAMSPQLLQAQINLIQQRLVPALEAGQFSRFSGALEEYGTAVGEYFAEEQGGVFSSSVISALVSWLRTRQLTAAVQSSWGPTICIPAESAAAADQIRLQVQQSPEADQVTVRIVRGLNSGASIRSSAPEVLDQRFLG